MGKKIRVLMVDDEEQFRSTTSKILTRRGYQTTVAESGEAAIGILKKSAQDVVVLGCENARHGRPRSPA